MVVIPWTMFVLIDCYVAMHRYLISQMIYAALRFLLCIVIAS